MAGIIQIGPNGNFDPTKDEEFVEKQSDKLIAEDSFESLSKSAMELAEVNGHMAQARDEFGGAVTQRLNTPISPEGTPTFGTLVNDIGETGKQIQEERSESIENPNVKRQFGLQFKAEVQGEQIKAKGVSRQQQMQFMTQSFDAEHSSLVKSAAADPITPAGPIIDGYGEKLAAATRLGLFTDEEASTKLESFRSDIARTKFNALAELDPFAAQALLQSDPESTQLNEEELQQAGTLVSAKLNDVRSNELTAQRDQASAQEAQKRIVTQDLVAKIESGEAGQADLFRSKALVSADDFKDIKRKFNAGKQIKLKKDRDHQAVLERVSNGDDLSGFTPKQIENSYSRVLDHVRGQMQIPEGESVSLSVKASIARVFKGRIKPLEAEMEHALVEGDIKLAVESLNAYRIVSKENPEFTSFLHQNADKAGEVAVFALQLVDKTDVPEQAAIMRARDAIVNADDIERSSRGSKFSKIKEFRPSNISETAREELGGDPFFGFNRRLAPGVTDQFHDLARESYILSGNKDAAIASAQNQMKRFYGETEFNGGRVIMFAPPEKMFPGVPAEKLKGFLDADLKTVFPDIDSSKVEIVGDDMSRIKKGSVSYGIQIRDANGIAVPLIDPNTGQLVRWELDKNQVVREHSLSEARTSRDQAAKDRDLFEGVTADTIITEAQRQSRKEGLLFEKHREDDI
jgi:hypothetical protein